MLRLPSTTRPAFARAALLVAALLLLPAARPAHAILAGEYDFTLGQWHNVMDLNDLLGATNFYANGFLGINATVANIEGGWVWNGHETLSQGQVTQYLHDPNSPLPDNVTNYHATMVGHILAGRGDLHYSYTFPGYVSISYQRYEIGIAPLSTLWSGSIATNIQPDGSSFTTTDRSFLYPYLTSLRNGISGATADVVNGSWGSSGGSDGNTFETRALDALAASSGKTIVFAAGNGNGAPLNSPATMFNRIAVASYGGLSNNPPYQTVSAFSSAGPNEFFLPSAADGSSGTVISNARASVDLAAPGEDPIVAAYTGNPAQTNLYYVNQSGTSFAAPLVAGGAGLLVDAGKTLYGGSNAVDARVLKAVLMNSADRFTGWSNGLHNLGGLLVTTQSLDYATGAGRLDLARAYPQYTAGTHDVAGLGGGAVSPVGWDYGLVAPGGTNDYFLSLPTPVGGHFDVTLDWFTDASLDTNALTSAYGSFFNLDLEVWLANGNTPVEEIAASSSAYNNVELLSFDAPTNGNYVVRVVNHGAVYDFGGNTTNALTYGLAWNAVSVPEPSGLLLLLTALLATGTLACRIHGDPPISTPVGQPHRLPSSVPAAGGAPALHG